MNGTLLMATSLIRTSKWRWHPVAAPVIPTDAMFCPEETCCPTCTKVPPGRMWA